MPMMRRVILASTALAFALPAAAQTQPPESKRVTILTPPRPDARSDKRWSMPARLLRVVSVSMAPTLMPDDIVFVRRVAAKDVSRGDMLAFAVGPDVWIMRAAALPGDTIQMRGGQVLLNGREVAQRPDGEGPVFHDEPSRKYLEQFPGEKTPHHILDLGLKPADNTPVFVVPPGTIFVLGDNRDNANDSRFGRNVLSDYEGGPVKFDNVYGVVDVSVR